MKNEKYRFINGSLYEYDKGSNSYVWVWRKASDNTKTEAIKSYEGLMHKILRK